MAAGDDYPSSRLLLNVIEKIHQNGVDRFLPVNHRQPMARAPLAVQTRLGKVGKNHRRIQRTPLAAKKFFGDFRQVPFRLPRIGRSWRMCRTDNRI